jgi:hypothetical protein
VHRMRPGRLGPEQCAGEYQQPQIHPDDATTPGTPCQAVPVRSSRTLSAVFASTSWAAKGRPRK